MKKRIRKASVNRMALQQAIVEVEAELKNQVAELEEHSRLQAQMAVIKRHFPKAENCPDSVEKYEIHALMKQSRAEELKGLLDYIVPKLKGLLQ